MLVHPIGSVEGPLEPPRTGGLLRTEARWQETAWLRIRIHTQPAHTVVSLAGELDIADAEPLAFQLSALICAGHTRIVADLTELTFCDAPGLRILEKAARQAALRGGWVRLTGTRTPIRRIIRIAKLTQALPEYGTVENALADRVEPLPASTADATPRRDRRILYYASAAASAKLPPFAVDARANACSTIGGPLAVRRCQRD